MSGHHPWRGIPRKSEQRRAKHNASAWSLVVILWVIALTIAVLVLFGIGCDRTPSPVAPKPAPIVPTPVPTPMPSPETMNTPDTVPQGVPREALLYRNTIIRETRFYWPSQMRPDAFFGQIHQESRFKAAAASKFASGLAQFTPATAAGYNKAYPKDLQELCPQVQGCPLDPHWAIRAGVIYDRDMFRVYKFAVDTENQWGFTLAAYNGGSGWIDRELRACTASPTCVHAQYFHGVQDQCGNSTPARADWACAENQEYPNIILFRWKPLYTKWLGPLNNPIGVTQ